MLGPHPEEIVPGVTEGAEDLFLIQPLSEPLSDSEPPVAPVLSTGLRADGGEVVRRVPTVSGHVVSSAIGIEGPRPRLEIEWPGLDQDERDQVLDWLRNGLVCGGSGGSQFAALIRVDGPEGEAVRVRVIRMPDDVETLMARVHGRTGVYRIGPLEVEEVL